MKLSKKFMALSLMAVMGITMLAACGAKEEEVAADPAATPEATKVILVGSTSVEPLASEVLTSYQAANPDAVVEIQGVGSSAGIKAAIDGTATIGMSSRDIKAEELEQGLVETVIAQDGIAVVLNPANPVKNLTTDQIRDIFLGTITNWSEVGGNDEEILVVSRESGSGTRSAFEEILGVEVEKDGKKVSGLVESALQAEGTGAIKSNIASKTNAIGYVSIGYIDETVSAVTVNEVVASGENIIAGTYPVSRPFVLVTKGEAQGADKAFIDYILSAEGQAIVTEKGYVAIV